MPKGYWIGRATITDPERYKDYIAANGEPFARHGARFLVRGGTCQLAEGEARERNIVIEFPSYEAALACWQSPEYQAAKAKQGGGADVDTIVIEGYEGPQPS
jgi:uncharacterized protein (DUF1330 family)